MMTAEVEIHFTCLFCKESGVYRTSAVHLSLYSNGIAKAEFFCLVCRRENAQEVNDEFGEHLTNVGVAATIVRVPLELLEHPPAGTPPITATDAAIIEDCSLEVFYRIAQRELGLI